MTDAQTSNRARGLRFLLSPRWVSYFVLLVIFAVACGFLSHWQFERRAWRIGENQKIIANFDAEPVPLEQALPQLDSFAAQQEWLPVSMTGEYLAEDQLLARNRPYERQPGFEILTPFKTDSGEIFIVDRGWIPTGDRGELPDHIPVAPSGTITITARLKPGEPQIPGRQAPEGQVPTIYLEGIAESLDGDVYTGAYGLLRSESVDSETGTLTPKPEISEGNHLSYAFQWIIFAVIAAFGLVYGVRAEFRERNANDPRVQAAQAREAARAQRRRQRHGPSDADIEDALVDEALAGSATDPASRG